MDVFEMSSYPDDMEDFMNFDVVSFFPSPWYRRRFNEGLSQQIVFHKRSILRPEMAYCDDMDVPQISKHDPIDVVALLSGHSHKRDFLITKRAGEQVPIESLKGKYLLIWCFLIPVCSESLVAATCRSLIALNSELPEKERNNLQVVIVPKLRSAALSPNVEPFFTKVLYYHFLSAFPDNYLVIPPSDFYSCDYVCKSLKLSTERGEASLFIDPQQMVLPSVSFRLIDFGAAGFPFTDSRMEDLRVKDAILKLRLDVIYKEHHRFYLESLICVDDIDTLSKDSVSLEELVECPSLYNIEDKQEVVPMSYFSDKLVGLYIYYNGEFLDELGDVINDCDDEKLPFEIVLIRLSALDDPSSVLNDVLIKMEKYDIWTCNWWTFPFNDKVSRKLWRICDFGMMDKLIIVPPPGDKSRSGDLQGKAVIRNFSGVKAYPFTRETILERKLSALNSLTLESLLKDYDHLVCNKCQGKEWTVADLRGKHILLYFDELKYKSCGSGGIYANVHARYAQIQARYPDSEVVFAPLSKAACNVKGRLVSEMPWLLLPFFSPYLMEQLELHQCATVVAFGKDGRVLSRRAQRRLDDVDSLFDDYLRKEIVQDLHRLNQDDYLRKEKNLSTQFQLFFHKSYWSYNFSICSK